MSWRYQAVWTEHEGERFYAIIEVYLNEDGRLKEWTATPNGVSPGGESLKALEETLTRMMSDLRWEPTAFSEMATGMRIRSTNQGTNV